MWRLTRPALVYLVAVEAAAVVAIVATATLVPITSQALVWCGLLVAAEVVHLEAVQRIERIRELGAEGRPHMHLQSIWIFAGLLLLPPPLAVLVIVISYTHSWLRVYRRRSLVHRKVFSAATVVLACAAAGAVLHLSTGQLAPFMPHIDGPAGLAGLLLAGVVYFGVNYVLVILMIIITNPDQPGRHALGNPSDVLIVLAAVGTGCGTALVVTARPWLLPVFLVPPIALHLGLLLPQLQTAARSDSKTGILAPEFWSELTRRELVRAERLGSTAGVLMIDIDHFKQIDDGNGHLAGDEVLRAIATAITDSVRSGDYVGRYGGDEFVALLPGVTDTELLTIARRVKATIAALEVPVPIPTPGKPPTVTGLTASIGAALYPHTANDYTSLLHAADDAAYTAKNTGRNRVVIAPPSPTHPHIPLQISPES
ncbi:diguanylate cyclase (GGDEF) domain-containing protein [Amycolatopsis arida]|uniref:Diguanylate cyclase (GGDEF) domain-containing protein n=1 Tax=Amycolatopsis arida TaxID=587909 RepID=A0A1I6ADU7_9PSEU|nr:GGDEF domain-containing protein [Amycolatopsis arida]TDX97662.1 diguanylate cyclase (GGDEF)-like protein [Amycolatopsis arida]SFQ66888.1 diguanylate cyclase (GGDEF) domain-containing protein [Amycolatopsis arida]